ncbi:unnamed protein product (macronuclear) [Paramecium tetraurelia]|uniref:Protein MAK16 homolog n=1 Tax=Paramecium tetraurelia TaxID=5888 RepID=A0BXM4_PARTE|nr:uncharacterized protein GSPATT00033144001 [Paramecium tetraurelia]CAK63291.1 unnamed protein product [Paramecium tetraurelia]|eukprot:XP_001430689.1 hypothetical protein (macronuclear) [Paramecium tetraurelia strain d4-2]
MQIDEVVWQVINRGHCSFKIKTISQNFCRNEYNVTGLCSKQSCPLANSQYATIKEEKGLCYLYVKTAERAQKPKELWEKILLSKNYEQALAQIDEQLKYWSNFMIHKNKQRLTKLRQMLIRIRKMRLKGFKELIPIKKKAERRDKIREQKALVAANLENAIEQELIDRLKNGVYNEIMNYNTKAFEKFVGQNQVEDEEEREQQEQEEEEEDYSDEELIFDPNDLEEDDEEDQEQDDEEDDKRLFQKQTFNQLRRDDDEVKDVKKKKPRVKLQYEEEEELEDRKKQQIAF